MAFQPYDGLTTIIILIIRVRGAGLCRIAQDLPGHSAGSV